ncbi:WXG100 family type VII secretion target [Nonomuraea spiralis]|uniref:WXG100 family type VII secretion target n=1 Tax=Nonomuraea spiralis TaxID=46182 RepID=UPI00379A537D
MAEPKKQTFKLVYDNGPPDTSTPEVTFLGSLGSSTLDQVKKWIDATDPSAVKLAGLYYSRAETLLNGVAADLKTKAADLAKNYTGPAAVETQKQLQALHASVRELARKLGEMGRPLQGYGETLHWAQANVVESMDHDSRSDRDVDWAGRVPFYRLYRGDKRAVDHLKKVNERIVEHYKQLPVDVQTALPDPSVPELPDYNNGGGKVPGAPNLNGDGVPDGSPLKAFGPGSVSGDPGSIDGSQPGDGSTSTVRLPDGAGGTGPNGAIIGAGGYNGGDNPYGGPDASALNSGPLGSSPDTTQSANIPSGPSAADGGTTKLAGYDPSLSGMPNGGYPTTSTTGGGPNGGGGTGSTSGYGVAGAAPAGAAGMRTAGAGGGMLAPSLMGAAPGRGGESGQKNDSEGTTWLAEDDDVWGGPEGTTPSTLT